MDSLPFPRLNPEDPRVQYLLARTLALVCVGSEMSDLWNALSRQEWFSSNQLYRMSEPQTTDEKRRVIEAEIDAFVAKEVFGLTRTELSYIIDNFPIVEKRDRKIFGEFRTKRRILEVFDELGSAKTALLTSQLSKSSPSR